MALLNSLIKPYSRGRLVLIASCLFFLILLSFTANPKVRTRVGSGIHKAMKRPQDISKLQRVIVMGTVDPDIRKWYHDAPQIANNFTSFVYWLGDWDREEFLKPVTKKGREAAAYLSFIVDNYDGLPKYMFFVHDNEGHWHNDVAGHKTENTLPLIRTEAIEAHGYVNLRCLHEPGCPASIKPHNPEQWMIEKADTQARFKSMYSYIFNTTEEDVPHEIGATCCAQFAVSRGQVRQRPKAAYQRMLDWLEMYNDNDFDKGWVFERIWHIVFGQEAVSCPSEGQCRCDLYGWCGPLPNGQTFKPIQAAPHSVASAKDKQQR